MLIDNCSLQLLTNNFDQSSICFRQNAVIETNCTSMKQFRFYFDKLHCIRSDIVQKVVSEACPSEDLIFIVSNSA